MSIYKSALVAICLCGCLNAQPPATMTKIVVRLIGPGITPGSFAALPKTMYTAPPHYARIEDPPDARQGIEKLTIIAEPDAYSANMLDKKGTHAIDQGGADDLHLPIVLAFDPNHKLAKLDRLEFGNEVDFFTTAGAKKTAGPTINGKPTDAYRMESESGHATLIVKTGTQTPTRLTWQTPDGTYTYEYVSYEDVPFDAALFRRPPGVSFREILPDPNGGKP